MLLPYVENNAATHCNTWVELHAGLGDTLHLTNKAEHQSRGLDDISPHFAGQVKRTNPSLVPPGGQDLSSHSFETIAAFCITACFSCGWWNPTLWAWGWVRSLPLPPSSDSNSTLS